MRRNFNHWHNSQAHRHRIWHYADEHKIVLAYADIHMGTIGYSIGGSPAFAYLDAIANRGQVDWADTRSHYTEMCNGCREDHKRRVDA